MVNNLPAMQETRFNPWVRKIPWRREWQPATVFLPGDSHRQRSLEGYSPQGCKELDTTEQQTLYFPYRDRTTYTGKEEIGNEMYLNK